MRFNLIAAQSLNGVIGNSGQIPWHLPSDMAFFRRMTEGNVVIMGRKTFESMGRPLPNRRNILLTHNPRYRADGVEVFHHVDEMVTCVSRTCALGQEAFIIGGEAVYQHFLEKASTLYLTLVDAVLEGDAFFPRIAGAWHVDLIEEHDVRPTRSLKGEWYPHRMYKVFR